MEGNEGEFPEIPDKAPDAKKAPLPDQASSKEQEDLSRYFKRVRLEIKRVRLERKSNFRGHVHKVAVGALYLVAGFYAIALFTWFYHLLMPASLHYMPSENNDVLKNLLFGTIVGGLISQFANKVFNDND